VTVVQRTGEYVSWYGMKSRCLNPNSSNYHKYGAKGITVCKEWMTFEGFFKDMGERPPGMTLHRLDNDDNYTPENCEWADASTQQKNKGGNTYRWVTYKGQTLKLEDWADLLDIKYCTLHARLHTHGWSVEKALETPIRSWIRHG